jgi:predicted amidohydrolase
VRIAACQLPHVHNDLPRAMSLVTSYAVDAQHHAVQLVCFPECFLQGYDVRAEHVREVAIDLRSSEFAHILRSLEVCEPVIVVGVIEREGSRFYNSAVAIDHGKVVSHYRKTHLLNGEQSVFEAGKDYPVFEVHGTKVGINICYDLNFSEAIMAASDAGAELVACPCNNMMRRSTAEEWKLRHNEIRAARAREGSVWLVSSDVTGEEGDRISYGPTAVIDPKGMVIDQVPLMTTGMLIAEAGRAARGLV